MAIKRIDRGWQVDVQPGGRGHRRIRRTFESKAEALRFERWVQAQASKSEPWRPKLKDRRRLTDLINRWYNLHGSSLRDGGGRKRILERNQVDGYSAHYSAYRKAVNRTGLVLPEGQLAHVLRHTFASHFMQRGGSILVLQRILGHSDIRMTMRYAHFAPEHLSEAVALNPLAPR